MMPFYYRGLRRPLHWRSQMEPPPLARCARWAIPTGKPVGIYLPGLSKACASYFRTMILVVAGLFVFLVIGPGSQAEAFSDPVPHPLSVSEIVVATGVENMKPVGAADRFARTVEKLFCFTRITGAGAETFVHHLWFYGDHLVSEVSLPVKRASWRTYSTKTIHPGWTGSWRVDVTAEDGTLLKSISFTIQ